MSAPRYGLTRVHVAGLTSCWLGETRSSSLRILLEMELQAVVSQGTDWSLLLVSSEKGRTGPVKVAWYIVTGTVMRRNFLISSSWFPAPPQNCSRSSPEGIYSGGGEGCWGGEEGQGPLAPFKISFLGFGTFMAFNDLLLCSDCQSGHT